MCLSRRGELCVYHGGVSYVSMTEGELCDGG